LSCSRSFAARSYFSATGSGTRHVTAGVDMANTKTGYVK
jgi:hypothetical protein